MAKSTYAVIHVIFRISVLMMISRDFFLSLTHDYLGIYFFLSLTHEDIFLFLKRGYLDIYIQWLSKLTNHLRKEKCSIFIVPTKGARDVKLSLCCRALLVVCLVSVSIKSFLSFIFLFRKNKKVRNFFASKLTNQNTKTIFQM